MSSAGANFGLSRDGRYIMAIPCIYKNGKHAVTRLRVRLNNQNQFMILAFASGVKGAVGSVPEVVISSREVPLASAR